MWLVLEARAAAALQIQPRISQPGSGKGEQVQHCTPKAKPAPLVLFCSRTSRAEAWCLLLLNTSELTESAGGFP